ncbi:hypothetical protein CB0940_02351 [Cercospora beticola]|uniref:AB hydrolase-1 domain-containing protein n=1 Tax=Cercospora beticola TaxID=122368 RepID=A0A2G5I409_CERBT|nr:hypothetical protein CB0940_02351 [Cercospora beticola]PIA99510.1 hypothetical protein CB0940_02351 [Cercospora beticola]WPA99481.1 hypothetical protein RHO25_004098 [Cercospora beticola]
MSGAQFVLVHGAWHTSWHWKFLASNLTDSGYTVSTVDLPSVSPDVDKVLREGALRADVEVVQAALERAAITSDKVIPVFHSYGGMPGGEAAAELSDHAKAKMHCLVYMCAFLVPAGKALLTDTNGAMAPFSRADRSKDHVASVPDPISIFYHDIASTVAEEAAQHVSLSSMSAFTQEIRHSPWEQYRCAYIFTEYDRALPLTRQESFFAHANEACRTNWTTFTLAGGHSPFLSRPEECADIPRQLAMEWMSCSIL